MPAKRFDNSKRPRVSAGDFIDAEGLAVGSTVGQLFLDAATRWKPEFATDLIHQSGAIAERFCTDGVNGLSAANLSFIELVLTWAETYRLQSKWAVPIGVFNAMEAANAVQSGQSLPARLVWHEYTVGEFDGNAVGDKAEPLSMVPRLEIEVAISDLWRPDRETRSELRQRILSEAGAQLDHLLNEAVRDLRESGLRESSSLSRNRFDWLAQRLVARRTIYAIARASFPDKKNFVDYRNTVRTGIAAAAQYLGLTLPDSDD